MAFFALTGIDPNDPIPGGTPEIFFKRNRPKGDEIGATMATLRDKFGITDDAELRACLGQLPDLNQRGPFDLGPDTATYFAEQEAAGVRFGSTENV